MGSKRILILLSVLFFTGLARAEDKSSGCGLGWAVFKDNSLISSLFRAWTNATFSSTFAMTSGTSGCAKHSLVKNSKFPEHFTRTNYHQLMVEMAKGKGEYLDAYALVMGCVGRETDFANEMKDSYHEVYSTPNVGPQDVLAKVKEKIRDNPALANHCQSAFI